MPIENAGTSNVNNSTVVSTYMSAAKDHGVTEKVTLIIIMQQRALSTAHIDRSTYNNMSSNMLSEWLLRVNRPTTITAQQTPLDCIRCQRQDFTS